MTTLSRRSAVSVMSGPPTETQDGLFEEWQPVMTIGGVLVDGADHEVAE